MNNIEITPYTPDFAPAWDEFVRQSRNATFLLERGYMDYHADRFADCSLIAARGGKIVGLLPCCSTQEGGVSSHAGLTYGGWMLPPSHVDGASVLGIFDTWLEYLRNVGVRRVDYKPLPGIYAARPSQEDLYALWRSGFTLKSRLLSSTVDLREPWKFDMSKRQQVRKAMRAGVGVSESADWDEFWSMLRVCLAERHEAEPVHSLSEMKLLRERFPDNIRLFVARDAAGEMQSGAVIYDTGRVAHSQYAATTAAGRRHYMLTLLYHHLMTEVFANHRYFDFGTSNESGGTMLNAGLLAQKFSMGATGTVYDIYTLSL